MTVLLKAGALLLAAFSLVSASPAIPQTIEPTAIPKLVCPTVGGYATGSAFRIGPHLLLSVKHVTNFGTCTIDGRLAKVIYTSPASDFSVISDERSGPSLKVDCGGFVEGRKYLAIGHARGLDKLTIVELVATGKSFGGFYALRGIFTVVPGQSGGAVIDAETGRVVGTINVYDMQRGLSGSIELKGTSVCK